MAIKPSTHQKLWLFFALLISTLSATAQPPTASFTATPMAGCAPLAVTFNATGSTGSGLSYNWNLGNTPPVTVPTTNATPQTVYSNPGTYTVTLSVTNSNGTSATVTKTITVHPNPVSNFTATPASGCPPLTTNFAFTGSTGGAGTMNYVWSVANGPLLSGTNPSTTYTTSGCRNVTLTVTNTTTGCAAALTKNSLVCVHEKPTVNFTASPTIFCNPPAQVNFNATATGGTPGYTYNWNFGSTNQSPTHTYSGPGPIMYSPSVTVTDANGCSATETKTNYIQIKKLQASMNGPATICAGQPASFVNTSTPIFTGTLWNFGSGMTVNSTHVFHTPGTYTVMMVAEDGPCRDTAYKNITVHARPTIDFTINPAQPCPAPVTVGFNATGGTSYTWSFGGPNTANTSNTYPSNGTQTVWVVGQNANGCKDTAEKSFDIHPWTMTLDSDPDLGGCAPLTVDFNVDNNYFYPITDYTWSIGGSSGTNPNKQLVFNTPGIYTVTVTATASNGCTKTATKTIKVGAKTNPSFHASPTTACASELVFFTNTTPMPWDEATFFFGDGNSGLGNPNAVNNYDTSGIFTVKLVVKYNECRDTVIRTNYITIKDPVAKANFKVNCSNPKQVEFTNTSRNYTSFIWHFGDGNTSTALNPIHTYAALGNYTARIVAHNSTTGCYDSFSIAIMLIDPQTQLTGADLTLCQGDKTQFTGGFTNPAYTPILYWWYVNGTMQTIDSGATYTHTFPSTGYYTIQLVTTDMIGCRDTVTRTNYVLVSRPTPSFTSTTPTGCSPINVTFTDNSTYTPGTGYTSRAWNFGANGASPVPGPSPITRTFTRGTYDIKLVVTDTHGCKDSITKSSYVEAWKPTAAFDASDSNSCIGTVLTFNDKSTNGGTANWWFGDGGQGTGSPITHAYNNTGQYTVRMVSIDSHNCKDTMTLTNIINIAKPTASFTISPKTFAICPPLTVSMNNQSTGQGTNTYAWDLGDGNTDNNTNTNNTYTAPGVFNVRLIAISDQGCRDTAYQTINILGYAGSLDYSPLKGCNPLTVNFTTNLTNVPSLVWDFNDGSILAATNGNPVSHTYTVPGSYKPKLLLSDGAGCSSTSEGLKTIEVDDVWARFKFSPACVGAIVTFEDTSKSFFSPVSQRHWLFHDGTTSTNTNPSVYYPNAGSFPIVLSAENANGCKDTLHTEIIIHDLPKISGGPDTTICLGDAAQLIGSGGISYKWSPPNELTCTDCTTPMASPKTTFTYTVIGTDANRCSDTDAVTVYIKTKTDSDVDPGGEICDGEAFLLRAYGATSYVWTPASSLNENNIAEPTAQPNQTTKYMVVAREGSCIPDTGYVNVTVFPRPTITASGSTTIIAGGEAQLQSSGERIDRFQWSHSNTLNCDDCPSPLAKPTRTTNYTVTAYTDHGCQDSSHVTITVLCDNSQLFIPNTFTPNGDGQNDKFFPRGVGIDQVTIFRVFNRWGEVVYERNGIQLNDELTGWDGTFKGQQLSPDVFVYIVEAKCDNGDILKWKGDVSLVR
jgi:gliding motility-associated-like protein